MMHNGNEDALNQPRRAEVLSGDQHRFNLALFQSYAACDNYVLCDVNEIDHSLMHLCVRPTATWQATQSLIIGRSDNSTTFDWGSSCNNDARTLYILATKKSRLTTENSTCCKAWPQEDADRCLKLNSNCTWYFPQRLPPHGKQRGDLGPAGNGQLWRSCPGEPGATALRQPRNSGSRFA